MTTSLSSEQAVCKLVVMCAVIWKLDTVYREAWAIQKLNCPITNSRLILLADMCSVTTMIFQFQVPPNLAVKGQQRSTWWWVE